MPTRLGKYTLRLDTAPCILGNAAVVGKKEGQGPLKDEFDEIIDDGTLGEDSWEKAESALQKRAVEKAIEKSGISSDNVKLLFAGDLLSQCSGSSFGARDLGIPFVGLYGACSTMALSLARAALTVESGAADIAAASTSSHFCSAEKQFRTPQCDSRADGAWKAAYRSGYHRQNNRSRNKGRQQHGRRNGSRRLRHDKRLSQRYGYSSAGL